jgi:hypothetical protein
MTMAVTDIRFLDLPKREEEARQDLVNIQAQLDPKRRPNPTQDEQKELARVNALLAHLQTNPTTLVDPLFVAVRDAFAARSGQLSNRLGAHADGVLKFLGGPQLTVLANPPLGDSDTVWVSLVLGLLAADDVPLARTVLTGATVNSDTNDPRHRDFTKAFFAALGEVEGSFALANLVLPILQLEGDRDGTVTFTLAARAAGSTAVSVSPGLARGEVSTREFARVMRCLVEKEVTALEPQLRRRVNECLNDIQDINVEKSPADFGIDLPNLETITAYNIQEKNVEAMGPMICAAMFDELKAFDVVDTILYQWQQGTLSIDVGEPGRMLYKYWKDAPNRMSEPERRGLYAMTMGIPGGSVNGNGPVNRDFNDLWMRFVSSVSSLVRQQTVEKLLRQAVPQSVGQQAVRKAARDLAANLSRHAFGIVNYAARDLQDQIKKMIELLDHKEIKLAYGARDMWGVIDQVATLELGGARSSARYRTLATCGAIITRWLAQNVKKYNSASSREVIDLAQVTSSDPPSAGPNATKNPTDYDLVNACELWLADTAIPESQVEDVVMRPRETPAMTSQPVQIPSFAKDVLESLPGLSLAAGTRH